MEDRINVMKEMQIPKITDESLLERDDMLSKLGNAGFMRFLYIHQ